MEHLKRKEMYNATNIITGLTGLVGWRNDDYPADLKKSDSGLYFNSQHPLLTDANLRSIAPAGKDAVFYDWLMKQTEDGIVHAVQRLLTEKLASQAASGILQNKVLYDMKHEGTIEIKAGEKHGVALRLLPAFGIVANIQRIGIWLKTTTDVTITLEHNSTNQTLQETTIQSDANRIKWHTLNWKLDKQGGTYYISIQPAVETKAIVSDQYQLYFGRYLAAAPYVEKDGERYEQNQTSGINLHLNATTDFTDFLIDQKHQLQDLIAKQVAINILRTMAFNPESRIGKEGIAFKKMEILYEIDGDSTSVKKSGLKYEYEQVLKGIVLDTNKLDNLVFSKKRKSLRYGTI